MGNGGDVRCPFHVKVFNTNNNIINDTNTLKKENLEAENGIPPYDRISHSQGRASYVTCRASITVEAGNAAFYSGSCFAYADNDIYKYSDESPIGAVSSVNEGGWIFVSCGVY